MSVGWNLNDSITSPTKYIFPFFHQNDCTPPKCGELSEYTDSAHTEVEDPSSRCTNASDEYDLPAPPVGGLPIFQDWLDRMNLVRNRAIPITLLSEKNILADTIFKISIRHNNLGMRQLALASLMTNVFVHRVSRQIVALCSPNMPPTEHLRDITDRSDPHLQPPANQQELNEYSKS